MVFPEELLDTSGGYDDEDGLSEGNEENLLIATPSSKESMPPNTS